jgi:hypothetical protein
MSGHNPSDTVVSRRIDSTAILLDDKSDDPFILKAVIVPLYVENNILFIWRNEYTPVKKNPIKVKTGKTEHTSDRATIINNSPGNAEKRGRPIFATEKINQKNENIGSVSAKPDTRILSRYPKTEYKWPIR